MNILIAIVFNLITTVSFVTGADNSTPVKSVGDLIFYLDTSCFRATKGRTIHEFYYNIPLSRLSFKNTTTGFADTLKLTLLLTDSSNHKIADKQWIEPIFVDSLNKIEGMFLPQQFEVTLYPSQYFVSLTISEISTGFSGTALMKITTPSFVNKTLNLSDIQLAGSINPGTTQDQFVKNKIKVLPNPNRVFGNTLPFLYFYFEIYNIQPGRNEDENSYEIKYHLTDLNDTVVRQYPSKIKQKPGSSSFEVGGINITMLGQFSLKLVVTVTDNYSGQTATATKSFWTIPAFSDSPANEAEKMIMAMSEEEIEQHFNKISYIISPPMISDFKKLNYEGKRNFLINFWVSNDPDPATSANEFWDNYFEKIDYANQKFSSGFKEGWKTDRGRIVLKYGKPDNVQYFPLTNNSKPYEVWYYYQPEQMQFIFVDEDGFGRFRLIYSSDEKELTDPNWQLIIVSPWFPLRK